MSMIDTIPDETIPTFKDPDSLPDTGKVSWEMTELPKATETRPSLKEWLTNMRNRPTDRGHVSRTAAVIDADRVGGT